MKINIDTEEYMDAKMKKYTSIASTIFVIYAIILTFNLLIKSSQVVIWLMCLILGVIIGSVYVYTMLKIMSNKEPQIILTDDFVYCNFKQVPTKLGSLKRKLLGTYESVNEECRMDVITHYEVTDKNIIAYGYDSANTVELTGFVVERYFSEDDEALIVTWLQGHITNIYNNKTQYFGK
jgi:hypothetical protein